jgi:hypothetical protein
MWDAIGRLRGIGHPAARASLVWVALALGACGGPTYEAGMYRDEEARYRIGALGPTWERIDVAQNDLAWVQPDSGAIVQVNATCDPYRDVPLTSLTNHLLIGFTERDWRSSEVVDMDGREARRSHVVASLDGVPRELLLYVMKKDSCVYDFALVAPPGPGFARAEPYFERFVGSFHAPSAEPR